MISGRSYPQPTIVIGEGHRDHITHLEWDGHPYYVEITCHDTIYLKVEAKKGYRKLNSGKRGFICESTNARRIERLTRRYLRVAWRLNHNLKYAADTKTIVSLVVARYGPVRNGG